MVGGERERAGKIKINFWDTLDTRGFFVLHGEYTVPGIVLAFRN